MGCHFPVAHIFNFVLWVLKTQMYFLSCHAMKMFYFDMVCVSHSVCIFFMISRSQSVPLFLTSVKLLTRALMVSCDNCIMIFTLLCFGLHNFWSVKRNFTCSSWFNPHAEEPQIALNLQMNSKRSLLSQLFKTKIHVPQEVI